MENPTGRGSTPAELPPLNLLGDQNDRRNGQTDSLYNDSNDPLRQLEADLRLPIGFLDIHERPDRAPAENPGQPKEQTPRRDTPSPQREEPLPRREEPRPRREDPVPYYPEEQRVPQYPMPNPNQYPDPTNRVYRPTPDPRTNHQNQWWRDHQAPPQTDWRDWRTYVPSPGPKNPHQDQWWRNHQRPGYPDQDWRRNDPRNDDYRRPDQDWQRQQDWIRRQQEIERQQEWQRQQLERQRRQQYPNDRQQYPNDRQQYPNDRQQYPNDRQQYPNDRTREAMDPRLNESINYYLGKKVSRFDRTVPDELGCARAVALALEKAYGIDIRSQGTDNLDQTLRKYGWTEVDSRGIKSGDVIIGRRANRPGHAAIYVGGNEIFNNDSNAKQMQIDSLDKFRSPEFVTVKVYRKSR